MQDLCIVIYSLFLLISDCLCDFQIMQMRTEAGKTGKKGAYLWSKKKTYNITEVVVLEIKLLYFQRAVLLHLPLILFLEMLINTPNPVIYHA